MRISRLRDDEPVENLLSTQCSISLYVDSFFELLKGLHEVMLLFRATKRDFFSLRV